MESKTRNCQIIDPCGNLHHIKQGKFAIENISYKLFFYWKCN